MQHPETLTQGQRIDLKEKLQLIAEWYFTKENYVETGCGICCALSEAFHSRIYYDYMELLLIEMHKSEWLAKYTNTYEQWEERAYMCLFLVEYLKDTIQKEKV